VGGSHLAYGGDVHIMIFADTIILSDLHLGSTSRFAEDGIREKTDDRFSGAL
jgi:metallophosphoesterase superfamily enzyme